MQLMAPTYEQPLRKSIMPIQLLNLPPFLNHFLLKWLFAAILIGLAVGSASAFFLVSLDWVTQYREANTWIIWFLPIAGLLIGLSYYLYGREVESGNNLIIDQYYRPDRIIPFKMAPLVLFTTLATHLFGGSAGREGTAVQMGGAIVDRLTDWFGLDKNDRRIILIMGISAGFASVFGTPLAGAVFALEVLLIGGIRKKAILPSLLVAFIADAVCHAWKIEHTAYSIAEVPSISLPFATWAILAGGCFGIGALLFERGLHGFGILFSRSIPYPPLRPVVGGLIIAIAVWLSGSTKYIGLGIPTIQLAFDEALPAYDFLAKIVATTFTLSAGFKGGEVTPLFFTGATMGNMLSGFIPLPLALLAGMGFVGVFAGATHTPMACTIMGMELFGYEAGLFLGISCLSAYLVSGHFSIYRAQLLRRYKYKSLRPPGRK